MTDLDHPFLNEAVRYILDGPHLSVLATIDPDGKPQTSVIFVKRDGDDILFSTIKGRRKTINQRSSLGRAHDNREAFSFDRGGLLGYRRWAGRDLALPHKKRSHGSHVPRCSGHPGPLAAVHGRRVAARLAAALAARQVRHRGPRRPRSPRLASTAKAPQRQYGASPLEGGLASRTGYQTGKGLAATVTTASSSPPSGWIGGGVGLPVALRLSLVDVALPSPATEGTVRRRSPARRGVQQDCEATALWLPAGA